MTELEQFFLDPFHACALAAWWDIARETKQIPPESEAVKQRAYQYYEQERHNG